MCSGGVGLAQRDRCSLGFALRALIVADFSDFAHGRTQVLSSRVAKLAPRGTLRYEQTDARK